jgi:SAM-dependent methyltransferase
MMLGLRHRFDYYACDDCGVLQISEYPRSLDEYYPPSYYSFSQEHPRRRSRVVRWLRRRRARHLLGHFDPVGTVLGKLKPGGEFYQWFKRAEVTLESAILDVGCGGGAFLRSLRAEGFTRLEGVDPFTREADRTQEGFVIRRSLAEVDRRFDFVLFDDSLEHMPDQLEVLTAARRVCVVGGWVCLGLPVLGEAWRRYHTDWVQLDAPRHFYLHTERSIDRLARLAGFTVETVQYDSTPFQFWGSEQYRLDVTLTDQRSFGHGSSRSLFAPAQIRAWEQEARVLNRTRQGDHATFLLRNAGSSS